LSSSRDLISLKRGPYGGSPDKQLSYLDLTCPANFPKARSGREETLQGYRDYFRIVDKPGVDRIDQNEGVFRD
jgi:hypothetical protein